MNLTIRQTEDAVSALEIAEMFHGSFFNDEGIKEIKKALDQEIFYGAYDTEKLVGFVTFKKVNAETVELSWIAVDSAYQGKGVGTHLVNESLNDLKEYRVCEVKTLAETVEDEGYAKTREFYRKLNFVPLEIIQPYPGWDKNDPCQIYVKFLG